MEISEQRGCLSIPFATYHDQGEGYREGDMFPLPESYNLRKNSRQKLNILLKFYNESSEKRVGVYRNGFSRTTEIVYYTDS